LSIIKNLKLRAINIKHELTAIYYAFHHPKVGIPPKIMIAFTLAYALSPLDLIPDFIPIIGYLDDLILIPLFITITLKMIPKNIMEECRTKAKEKPITLKDNWLFSIIFIAIWITILTIIIIAIIHFFQNTKK
jgi:uncharacterized membrane protein YkvA (DUF1232 family)